MFDFDLKVWFIVPQTENSIINQNMRLNYQYRFAILMVASECRQERRARADKIAKGGFYGFLRIE